MAGADDAPRAVITLVQDLQEIPLGGIDCTTRCDLGLVDDLLRLQLHAKRLGWTIRISEVRPDLRELFLLVGLTRQLDP
jgi:hypothetical protein